VSEDTLSKKSKWDIGLKVAMFVIPILAGWIIKLEVNKATTDLKIAELEKDVAEAQSVQGEITTLKVQIGRIETKSDSINEKIDSISDRLQR
jgi:peptidoglycan hydrolase CwlO-like protein